jgi:hypothetical protein
VQGENKAQEEFLTEYARSVLVSWCAHEALPDTAVIGGGVDNAHPVLLAMALEKGWVTKREPHRITAKGYSVAAAFLRR